MRLRQIITLALVILAALSIIFFGGTSKPAEADQHGENISKESTISINYNEENPSGIIDLKKIVEDNLGVPSECQESMVICQIENVSFEITIKKDWLKFNIRELNNYAFANTVDKIESPLDELSAPEIVIMQEVLARRGLLRNPDGSVVQERGFFGSLTWLALIKLAHIKNLDPNAPDFNEGMSIEINNLLANMGQDDNYVNNRPLPQESEMIPQEGDLLFDEWSYRKYISELAQNSVRVETEDVFFSNDIDVNIDGFVEVERLE